MNFLDALKACEGEWQGTNILHDPNTGKPDHSSSTAMITPAAQGKFIRLDYTWSYQGRPQAGSLLIGFEPKTGSVSGYWIDSFHMGTQAMLCKAAESTATACALTGSYPAPPGPDWHWRIELAADADSLKILMYNIFPDQIQEEAAVEASFSRLNRTA